MDYLFIGVAAFFVSIGSSIAGGGGGLMMTPLMIIMGFPPQTVLASAKASGLGINIGALSKFTREKKSYKLAFPWRRGQALVHAEAVLLVDDRQRQVLEFDVLLEQRMGADRRSRILRRRVLSSTVWRAAPLSRPVRSATRAPAASARGAMVAKCWRARISVGAISAAWPPPSTAFSMANSATTRLAAADIALQQAQHAPRRRHVCVDLADRLALRTGQAERQRRQRLARSRPSPRIERPGSAAHAGRTRPSASWLASSSS